jgi:alkanesulfonate monooxygenase SsuD/methylene tetrahydromethanopterin reductase-like flavin-dependent oxidoreductase (luciferase family)
MQQHARLAEAVGFDSVWMVDHMLVDRVAVSLQYLDEVADVLVGEPPLGTWEGWSLAAAVAAVTQRVEVGHLVTCVGYRNPALLAKVADTVDEISGGRLILGLGAGDFEDEFRRFGYPWERRVSRFEEALQIIVPLLREGRVDFHGEFYTARECELRPRGPRRTGPPILIGALAHAPRMLRLTAQYADLWNAWLAFALSTADQIPPLREAVDLACRKVGRDPASLARTASVGVSFDGVPLPTVANNAAEAPISGTTDAIAEAFWSFADQGISHIPLMLAPHTPTSIEAIGRVIERMKRGR